MTANSQRQDEQSLSTRCVRLLEEVKGLLENQIPSSSSANSVNEGASTSNQSNLTDERNRSVRIDINQPSMSSAPPTSRHAGQDCERSSRAVQNFRSLFSSYGSSRNSWVGPPLAKKAKKRPFISSKGIKLGPMNSIVYPRPTQIVCHLVWKIKSSFAECWSWVKKSCF